MGTKQRQLTWFINFVMGAFIVVAAVVAAVGLFGPTGTARSADGDSTAASSDGDADEAAKEPEAFTTAASGECLTWTLNDQGKVNSFTKVNCAEPHRFEVSSREDLALFPSSMFGPDAAMPDITTQANLREELCGQTTIRYLGGRYDNAGRYSIASILPPEASWLNGDRTMLCGLQVTDATGNIQETTGKVADSDQSLVYQPGTCLAIDDKQQLTPVDCTKPHQLETTKTVDLTEKYPTEVPSIDDQNEYLKGACTDAAIEYLGEEENLYQSTLQAYWLPIAEASWSGGSHTANCYLTFARDNDSFADLTGTATKLDGLKIDGEAVPEQPERQPLRTSGTPTPSASATATTGP